MKCPACGFEFEPEKKRGTRLGAFTLTREMRQWAAEKVPLVDVHLETEKFCNYWRSKAGRDATKLDWLLTWRNWMLGASERLPTNRYAPAGNGSRPVRETASPDAYVHTPAPMTPDLRAKYLHKEEA